jgi:hypothetical protein
MRYCVDYNYKKEREMKKVIFNEDDLIYGIVCNGRVIAMFMNVVDRDDVLGFLADRYEDCDFTMFDKN